MTQRTRPDNDVIATLARQRANTLGLSDLEYRAAGCLAVAFGTTRTPDHALRVLREHFAECGNAELLAACEQLIDELTGQAKQQAVRTAMVGDS